MAHVIKALDICSFRGIPGRLHIDLTSSTGAPCSLLLVGDNGSGKSSVTDAIEFALQSRAVRRPKFSDNRPIPVSLAATEDAQVLVTFADGSKQERTIRRLEDGHLVHPYGSHPAFAFAPVVLRRSDITRFWDTSELERQVLFFDYFLNPSAGPEATPTLTEVEGELESLVKEQLLAKEERRGLVAKLSQKLNVPVSDIPLEIKAFQSFVHERVHDGRNKYERKEKTGQQGGGLSEAVGLSKTIFNSIHEIQRIGRKIRTLKTPGVRGSEDMKSRTAEALRRIGDTVTKTFLALSNTQSFVERVELHAGTLSATSLSLSVLLKNGRTATPRHAFSEANLDLLAFLVFYSVVREAIARGQQALMVFDDVFQSIDASFRMRVIDYVIGDCPGWQFVITAHDRMWREHLRQILRRHGHSFVEREISGWTFEEGPSIVSAMNEPDSELGAILETGTPNQLCGAAGLVLERLAQELSVRLAVSVTRKKDDRYTLADLWPGVAKVLRKTQCKEMVDNVDRWLHLRNLLGAHYNEWALSLSREEAVQFSKAVVALTRATWCRSCGFWIEELRLMTGPATGWRCRCGAAVLSKV